MKERHPVRNAVIALGILGISLPLTGIVGGQVFGKSSAPESINPSAAPLGIMPPTPTSNLDVATNDFLKEKPTLADLDQWTKVQSSADGQTKFTAQTKDDFWANIIVKLEQEVWSAESYTADLLARLRKVDSDARLLTSDMTSEKVKIPKGGYLIIARSKQNTESIGLDSLEYWLILPEGKFNEKVDVSILTMKIPQNMQGIDYEGQTAEALRKLADNRPVSQLRSLRLSWAI